MRANLYAALCTCVLGVGLVSGPAKGGDYVAGYYGWHGSGCCYLTPFSYRPRYVIIAPAPYDIYWSAPIVYLPIERRRLVRFSGFSYSGLDAYAAADESQDNDCGLVPLADWRGGWVWSFRAGCY